MEKCENCSSCSSCSYCSSCSSCSSCHDCYYCFYCTGLRQSENMIFCLGDGYNVKSGKGYHKSSMAWNKEVSESRYNEITNLVKKILCGFNSDDRNSWVDEWRKVTASQWEALSEIPEFDREITLKITGLSSLPSYDNGVRRKAEELEEEAEKLLEKAKSLRESL